MGIDAFHTRQRGGRDGRPRATAGLCAFALFAGLLLAGAAKAECIGLPFPDLQALALQEDVDATQALNKARNLIAAGVGQPNKGEANANPTVVPGHEVAAAVVAA